MLIEDAGDKEESKEMKGTNACLYKIILSNLRNYNNAQKASDSDASAEIKQKSNQYEQCSECAEIMNSNHLKIKKMQKDAKRD